jgi:hypothetical protein
MGETKTRLGIVRPDSWMGENRSDLDKKKPLGYRCSAPPEVAGLKEGCFPDFSGTWKTQPAYRTGRKKIMKGGILVFTVLAMVLAFVGGCKVQVDKSKDGEEQNVKIATPFGGINVNQDQTSAAELGLAAYPGAVQDMTGEGSKSAKVDMGFGSWKLRVKVAHYATADRQDQVIAFYRNALSQYGSVIECKGSKAVGAPVITSEGLTCENSDSHTAETGRSDDLQLKAGSRHHQHLVLFKDGGGSQTHFSLIALDLPHGFETEQKGTN